MPTNCTSHIIIHALYVRTTARFVLSGTQTMPLYFVWYMARLKLLTGIMVKKIVMLPAVSVTLSFSFHTSCFPPSYMLHFFLIPRFLLLHLHPPIPRPPLSLPSFPIMSFPNSPCPFSPSPYPSPKTEILIGGYFLRIRLGKDFFFSFCLNVVLNFSLKNFCKIKIINNYNI